jgi:sarcosine/dimethylglycine N-methyltransferase
VGRYDNQLEETDESGYTYIRGDSTDITAATRRRDQEVCDYVLDNAPEGKLKVLELGSGRGALGRHVAKQLLDKGRLQKYTALNISERENAYSQSLVPDDLKPSFEIKLMSFDDLLKEGNFKEGTDFFDVIISTDAMYHSADKKLLVQTVAKLVVKGGIFYFSDYLTNPDSDPEKLKIINERFHPSDLYQF